MNEAGIKNLAKRIQHVKTFQELHDIIMAYARTHEEPDEISRYTYTGLRNRPYTDSANIFSTAEENLRQAESRKAKLFGQNRTGGKQDHEKEDTDNFTSMWGDNPAL